MIRVALADDQPLLLASFATLIDATGDMCVAGTARTGQEAVELVRAQGTDVILMDIRMPELDGLGATRQIAADERLAGVRVLILTTFEIDEYVFEALRAGASGFLGKSAEPQELLHAIRVVHRGDALLTPAATRSLIARFLSHPERSGVPSPKRPAGQPLVGSWVVGGVVGRLTEREREVLALVGGGLSNEDIARHLVVSPHTVKTHVNRTMMKLGAHDRAQLVVIAYETGLIRPGPHT